MRARPRQKGFALIAAVLLLAVGAVMVATVAYVLISRTESSSMHLESKESIMTAEAGLEYATRQYGTGAAPCARAAPETQNFDDGRFTIADANTPATFDPTMNFDNVTPLLPGRCRIRVTGTYDDASRTVEAVVQLTGGNAVTNGGFTVDLAGWTETIQQATGTSASFWSNFPLINGNPGSLQAQTSNCAGAACRGQRLDGYRAQVLTTPIPAGTNVNLQMEYCKNAIGSTSGGSRMDISIVIVYATPPLFTAWSDTSQPANPNCSNGGTWNNGAPPGPVNVNFVAARVINEIRILYDLRTRAGGQGDDSQKQVWFDEVQLLTGAGAVNQLAWREVFP